jgi:RNA-directed DNA polymerase
MQAGYPEGVSSEIAKFREPTVSGQPEGNSVSRENASAAQPCGVVDPRHAWKLHVREPRDPAGIRSRKAADRRVKAMSDKTHMNGSRESYSAILPAKQPNESLGGHKEDAEERALTKENTEQPNSCRTPSRENGQSGLDRVRQAARGNKQLKFTALLHHIDIGLLRSSYYNLKRNAAPGVDGVVWQDYEEGLEERLIDLHGRIHRRAYRAKPSLRKWIPKGDGSKQRPLGIAALEDKIVQSAVVQVLNQIWEEDFVEFSFGFRPGRSQHDALDALCTGIIARKVNFIVDLDIRSFFDRVRHDHLEGFIRERIGDNRLVHLILKWLKAGVMEDGKWFETKEGTPQGAVVSPVLANLYLHHVLDIWVKTWRKNVARGDVIAVRYADDAVLGFQYREEAARFLADLREQLQKYGLELHPEKTRLIEFGRYAAERRAKRGEGKPETFNFLGFTHICGKNHETGYFMVHRKTIGKRMATKLKDIRQKLRKSLHAPPVDTVKWLKSVVRGYFQYHAVPRNEQRMKAFRHEVLRMWWWQLRRRSQRTRWGWNKFMEKLGNQLPEVKVLHPYPEVRFALTHPDIWDFIRGKNRVR